MKLLVSLAFGLAAGCVTTPSAEEKMATWNGERSQQLVSVWGKPSDIAPGQGGAKTFVYKVQDSRMRIVESGLRGGTERVEQDVVECTVRFTVDASDRVRGFALDAEGRQCAHGITPNPNGMMAH